MLCQGAASFSGFIASKEPREVGVPEDRLFGSADPAPGQGSSMDKDGHRRCAAPSEQPGAGQGRASWLHLVKNQCVFLNLRATTGRPGWEAGGY